MRLLNKRFIVVKNTNLCVLCVIVAIFLAGCSKQSRFNKHETDEVLRWPEITSQCKPWAYWWWMGSAVDKTNLKRMLKEYQRVGMGGLHIVPLYGVKGYEDKFIDFLSPEWMEMLAYTVEEANQLGLGIDMTTGTGWPFGGAMVGEKDAASMPLIKRYELPAGQALTDTLADGQLISLMGYSENGQIIDLLDEVKDSKLEWIAPDGHWKLYAIFQVLTEQVVKRAAPGGEGKVLDPFLPDSMSHYLSYFDAAFTNYKSNIFPRAQYHDSYEYYNARWTDKFLEEFSQRRGYDLRKNIPAFFGEGDKDKVNRVKCDYKETLSDLHLDYIKTWVKWSHDRNFLTRDQAHGSPTNILDVYAACDIPETETFGAFELSIPGLRIDRDYKVYPNDAEPDVMVLKFASSAANVACKGLTASESCTWLADHFKGALSQAKAQLDQIFVSGINHSFYHGTAYSPIQEEFPGWLLYAMTSFSPSNNCIWHDIEALNGYISRCQSALQAGESANDILLYFPIHDFWHDKSEMFEWSGYSVHNAKKWLKGRTVYDVAQMMWQRGFTFDYISDRQIGQLSVTQDGLISPSGNAYKTIVVPGCELMPEATLNKLADLSQKGATVIFVKSLPEDVPGWGNLDHRREIFAVAKKSIETHENTDHILIGDNAEEMLLKAKVNRVASVDFGVDFVRRRYEDGYYYFMTNSSAEAIADWVDLGVTSQGVVIMDPLNDDKSGWAVIQQTDTNTTEVYLQLEPGQSCILRCLDKSKTDGPKWQYQRPLQNENGAAVGIEGEWQVEFISGGPVLPETCQIQTLCSWTDFGGLEAERFGGTARYTIKFDKPTVEVGDWLLDLGNVCESARVYVNGRFVQTLFSIPFKTAIGDFLRDGENMLEIEVTNLAANRIADLDRRKVNWKKFYDINIVNNRYEPFNASDWPLMDSGLLGPVQLMPLMDYDKAWQSISLK